MRKFGRGKTMKVADLFEVYKGKLKAPEKTVVQAFIEVASELLNITLTEKDIRYSPSTKTISMNGHGPLRSEVYIHKKEILAHLRARLGDTSTPKEIV